MIYYFFFFKKIIIRVDCQTSFIIFSSIYDEKTLVQNQIKPI